jgi:hypothetical protein
MSRTSARATGPVAESGTGVANPITVHPRRPPDAGPDPRGPGGIERAAHYTRLSSHPQWVSRGNPPGVGGLIDLRRVHGRRHGGDGGFGCGRRLDPAAGASRRPGTARRHQRQGSSERTRDPTAHEARHGRMLRTAPGHERDLSDRQPLPSLESAAPDEGAPAPGSHAVAEPVAPRPAADLGLISALHAVPPEAGWGRSPAPRSEVGFTLCSTHGGITGRLDAPSARRRRINARAPTDDRQPRWSVNHLPGAGHVDRHRSPVARAQRRVPPLTCTDASEDPRVWSSASFPHSHRGRTKPGRTETAADPIAPHTSRYSPTTARNPQLWIALWTPSRNHNTTHGW